jgi:parallel beta-helix repeat protein
MTTLLSDYQSLQTLTVTGLATLANGSSVQSASTAAPDWSHVLAHIQITTGAGATSGGTVTVAIRGSIDNTDFDDAQNERRIGVIVLPAAGAQSRSATFLLTKHDPLPPFWQLSITNATGAALTAATVTYRGVSQQTDGLIPVAMPVSTFTTQAGDGTTSLDTAANSMTIAFGTTATSLRGSYFPLVVGKRYRASWSMSSSNGTQGQAGFGTSAGGPQYRPTLGGVAGLNSFEFDAVSDTLYPTFQRASAGSTTFSGFTIAEVAPAAWIAIKPQPIVPAFWTARSSGVTVNATTGVLTIAATGTLISGAGSFTTVVGKLYRLAWTVGGNSVSCLIGTSQGGSTLKSSGVVHAVGSYSYEFAATSTTTWIQFQRQTSGTATVSGAVMQQLDEPLVATDFGLVPNAGTDQQTALQSFFDAADAQGRRAYLPTGTYNHSAPLTLTNTGLYGDGAGLTILHGLDNENCTLNITGTNPSVQRMTIQSTGKSPRIPRPSDRLGNGIYVVVANGYLIKNCHILNVGECGIMSEYSNNGKILNNQVELTTADGIYHTEGAFNIEIAYNKTITTGDDAISFTSYSAPQLVHDIEVHHNTVIGNFESRAITVNGCSNITIHSNHVDGGTAGISVGATTAWDSMQNTNITVRGNTVRDGTFTGEGTIGGGALHLYNDQTGTDTGIVFTNNDVYNPAHYGIYVWGTNQISATVSDNRFYQVAARTVFVNDNAGATQITQTNNTRFEPETYPGDKVPVTVGGLEQPLPSRPSGFSNGFSSGFG